jgi:hypothetical protein
MNSSVNKLQSLRVMTRSTKEGDVSDKSYLATTTDSPSYIHANNLCYDELNNMEVKHGKIIGSC